MAFRNLCNPTPRDAALISQIYIPSKRAESGKLNAIQCTTILFHEITNIAKTETKTKTMPMKDKDKKMEANPVHISLIH